MQSLYSSWSVSHENLGAAKKFRGSSLESIRCECELCVRSEGSDASFLRMELNLELMIICVLEQCFE
jgi:hypothetical protein